MQRLPRRDVGISTVTAPWFARICPSHGCGGVSAEVAVVDEQDRSATISSGRPLALSAAATTDTDEVLATLDSGPDGLSSGEAARRLREVGPNALVSHGARPLVILLRQLRNPLLILLVTTALVSAFVGERTDAIIILTIIGLSVGLGFVNEYRSARAVEELHSQLRHKALTLRDGKRISVDVTDARSGGRGADSVGDVVPADLRLLRADGLECDESVLTGESLPVEKHRAPVTASSPRWPLRRARSWARSCERAAGWGLSSRPAAGRSSARSHSAGGTPAADRLPAGPAGLLDAARPGHAMLAGTILVINLLLGPRDRVDPVCTRDRGRVDATAAAGDRDG